MFTLICLFMPKILGGKADDILMWVMLGAVVDCVWIIPLLAKL
jgi:hypothetical protein